MSEGEKDRERHLSPHPLPYVQPQPFGTPQATRPAAQASRHGQASPPRSRPRNVSSSDIHRDRQTAQRPTSPPTLRYPHRPESPLNIQTAATYSSSPHTKLFTPPPPPPPLPSRSIRPSFNVDDLTSAQETMKPVSASWDSHIRRESSSDRQANRRFPPVDIEAATNESGQRTRVNDDLMSPRMARPIRPSTAPYSPSETESPMTLQRPQTSNPTPTQLHPSSLAPSRPAISAPGYLPPGAAPPVQRYPDYRMETRPAKKLSSIFIDRAVLDKQPSSTNGPSLARGKHKSDYALGSRYVRDNASPLPTVMDHQSPTTPNTGGGSGRSNGYAASPV